jgi:hypothetical protein
MKILAAMRDRARCRWVRTTVDQAFLRSRRWIASGFK